MNEIVFTFHGGFDWNTAAGWIGAVAAIIGALATVALAGIAVRELPRLKRELTDTKHLTKELTELWDIHSHSPSEVMRKEATRDAPVFVLHGVELGQHADVFDRVTIEFEGAETPEYSVRYIQNEEEAPPNLPGSAIVEIEMHPSERVSRERLTGVPAKMRGQQVLQAAIPLNDDRVRCFVALRSPARFSTLTFANPPRVVVDFRHPAT